MPSYLTTTFEVIVENIGSVYLETAHGAGRVQARVEADRTFDEYVDQSRHGYGRASGEAVILLVNGEIDREYQPVDPNDPEFYG